MSMDRGLAAALEVPRTVVLTESLEGADGERVRALPVSDRATAGVALGMALAGTPVVVDLAALGRLPAVMEVLAEAVRLSQAGTAVPLVLRVPIGHVPSLDTATLGAAAGLGATVLVASSAAEEAALWPQALRHPTVLASARMGRGDRATGGDAAAFRTHREGTDAAIITWGHHVEDAVAHADRMAVEEGVEVAVHALRQVFPPQAPATAGRFVIFGEPTLAGMVRDHIAHAEFEYLEAPPQVVASSSDLGRAVLDRVVFW